MRPSEKVQKEDPIDFVVTWVDGNDPEWLAEMKRWRAKEPHEDWSAWTTGEKRYRDWGLLKYWFRAVEKYAPWVRKVHFVTYGHTPSWLDASFDKLHIVRHDEFIPDIWLPTFNSHCIELNMHRIEGLSVRFVYFNDDMFLTNYVKQSDFFFRGLPSDDAGLVVPVLSRSKTSYIPYSSMLLNEHFDFHRMVFSHLGKWLNIKYGFKNNMRTLLLLPFSEIPGMESNHLPISFLKSTFNEVWNVEGKALEKACSDRFRRFYGISPWFIRDWQRAKGEFSPRSSRFGRAIFTDQAQLNNKSLLNGAIKDIRLRRTRTLCINDEIDDDEVLSMWKEGLQNAFEAVFPNKSQFEL